MQTAPVLANAIVKALTGRSRVVVGVSQLHLAEDAAVLIAPSVLASAGGWPWAKLAVAGATPPLLSAIDRHTAQLTRRRTAAAGSAIRTPL